MDGSAADGIRVDRSPVRSGGLLALVVGAFAVGAVADADGQLVALAVELLALLAATYGVWRLRDGDRLLGVPLAVAGGFGVPAAMAYGVVSASRATQVVELVPGMVGLGLLALGVLPVRRRWSRWLVAAGAIAIGVGVVGSGIVRGAGQLRLLAGLALAVVAWDAAEQAINLGEQVGRHAGSAVVVGTHVAWSLGVGAVGVAAASGIYTVDVTGLPLVGVGLLLTATVAISTAAFT